MKRGQSQIITVVLLILLVLAAVVIVWNIVNRTVTESSEQVSTDQFSYKANLNYKIVSDEIINVTVERKSGGGNISEIKILLETDNESSTYTITENLPTELETKIYEINSTQTGITNFTKIKNVEIYFGYIVDGKNKTTLKLDDKKTSTKTEGSPGTTPEDEDPECVPETCSSLGKECGTWNDGCEGTLNCGSCESGYECNEGVCEIAPIAQGMVNSTYYLPYGGATTYFDQNGINDPSWVDKTVRLEGENCIINDQKCAKILYVHVGYGCWDVNNCILVDSLSIEINETPDIRVPCINGRFYIYETEQACLDSLN